MTTTASALTTGALAAQGVHDVAVSGAHAPHHPGFLSFLLIATIIGAQLGIAWWKKSYPKSFHMVSLALLFLIPFIWSVMQRFVRMILVWLAFTSITGRLMMKASRTPLLKTTPRDVYQWFFLAYKVCYGLATLGYGLILCDFFGISLLFPAYFQPASGFGIMFMFYGLYYGVLGRDSAIVCAERMASTMGYYSKSGLPSKDLPRNTCAICDSVLFINLRLDQDDSVNETIFTLNCGHQFHESCIRGWTMIGKKDTCAYCSEKVSLREMFKNPWETQNLAWGSVLDFVRYFVVFNPVILVLMQVVLYVATSVIE